eukprot:Nk52_evm1s1881 gene=Nk52_evmTU1s1881
MSHYIERRGRTGFTEEEKQWTRRVIGTLKGKLDRALQNKPRASVKEGDWVQLNADDNVCYRYRVMKKKRGRVYVTYAEPRDPPLRGSGHDNLILSCFASEFYPEDRLSVLDATELPTIN